MPYQLQFLTSNRFYAMLALVGVLILEDYSLVSVSTAQYIVSLLAGFIGIRTIDRFAEKSGSVDTGTK